MTLSGTDISKVYMYHSKTLHFRKKKPTRLNPQMFGQVLDMKKYPNIKSPLGSVMCSGKKLAEKEDINVG